MRRLALRLALFMLLAPGIEAVTRLDDYLRYGVPFSSGATGIADLLVADSVGVHARAGTRFRQFAVNTHGFRGAETTDAELSSALLIAVAGSSETFGLHESQRREWPMQLQDSLRRTCGRRDVVVLNAAMHGMSLPTSIVDLQRRVLRYRPRLVIYYPQPTQYLYARRPKAMAPTAAPPSVPSTFRLRALPRIRQAAKDAIPAALLTALRSLAAEEVRANGESLFVALPSDRLDAIDEDLRRLIGIVRTSGAEPVLVIPQHRFADTLRASERDWLRAWEKQVPKANAATLLEFADSSAQRIRALARDSAVVVVDPDLGSSPRRAARFADYVHFTDEGAALVAEAAAARIREQPVCSRASSPDYSPSHTARTSRPD